MVYSINTIDWVVVELLVDPPYMNLPRFHPLASISLLKRVSENICDVANHMELSTPLLNPLFPIHSIYLKNVKLPINSKRVFWVTISGYVSEDIINFILISSTV